MVFARSRAISIALGLLVIGALGAIAAPAVAAAEPIAPQIYVYDAPFVRSQTVEIDIGQPDLAGARIDGYRASNDPATASGVLVNGIAVGSNNYWTLASGPDGLRTIYAQVHYDTGVWSPVGSVELVLDATPPSVLSFDVDPQTGLGRDFPGADWHVVLKTPATVMTGKAIPDLATNRPMGMSVSAGGWSVAFVDEEESIEPGTYVIPQPVYGETATLRASVGYRGDHCSGGGTFDIHAIAFTPDGDLETLSADFRLICFSTHAMAGSIRYGDSDPIVALDQSVDFAYYDLTPIGTPTAAQSMTVTNVGSGPTTLGQAELVGEHPADFGITADSCSGVTLPVGGSCSVSLRFLPTVMGNVSAVLRIPDPTMLGGRTLWVIGFGLQPTTVTIDAQVIPAFGPGVATVVVTTTPDAAVMRFNVTDALVIQRVSEEHLTGPARYRVTYHVTLPPGPHDMTATIAGEGGYLASAATPVHVVVGIGTSLTLSTVTDDGVAVGESVDLIAKLQAGAALPGGTLRIRDGTTNAILASKTVSGTTDSLTLTVTRGLGTHAYTAQYEPPASDIQASSAAYDLSVVTGSRPETTMDTTTLATSFGQVHSAFGSPDIGVAFECRVNLSDWFDCSSPTLFQTNQFGTNTITVRSIRPNGLADRTPATRPWILDWTGPTATAPVRTTPAGRALLSQGRVSIHLAWSGADAESGVGGYDVEVQTDGRSYWERVASGTSATAIDAWFYPNHAYRVRVRGINAAGVPGEWATGTAWKQLAYQEWSSAVKYTGPWARVRGIGYLNEVANASSTAGAKATFTYTGTSISLISRLGPTRGRAAIYVDGVYVQTIDLYDKAYKNQRVVWSKTWSARAKHTVTVKVMGTSGRPRVEVDGFIVGS